MPSDKQDPSTPAVPAALSALSLGRTNGIIAFGVVVGLLYLGRDILIPLALALMLSLLLAPLVRTLKSSGMSQAPAVLIAVSGLAVVVLSIAIVLGTQVLRMAASLPQYQHTIEQKLQNFDDFTVGRLNSLTGEASRLIERNGALTSYPLQAAGTPQGVNGQPVPDLRQSRADPLRVIAAVLAAVWRPLETTGIVVVVLVFVLLEHEALRDRIIRVAGRTNIRVTTVALSDAGERLSRFFVSQFAVNLGVGVAIGIGLGFLGLPQAALWATLAALLRFVPYVGVWIAGVFALVLALAVAPGWSLAVDVAALFVLIEVIAGQLVEPQLFGHTTGLSPLSVVVAAIFWSSLWGPIGLVLSTPLTLCLLVGGRYIKTLRFLDFLLGNAPALTLSQRFYQRALSGDSQEILAIARTYLKRNTLATYCDEVLMPALHLARLDQQFGTIGADQLARMRNVIVTLFSTLGGQRPNSPLRRGKTTVLDGTAPGERLRKERELRTGRWQGPVVVEPGSVLICFGLGSGIDDLAAELLARILLADKLDARHFSLEDAAEQLPPETTPDAVAIVYLVSAYPGPERQNSAAVAEGVRQRLPKALLVNVFLPGVSPELDAIEPSDSGDAAVTSFNHAVQIGLERHLAKTTVAHA